MSAASYFAFYITFELYKYFFTFWMIEESIFSSSMFVYKQGLGIQMRPKVQKFSLALNLIRVLSVGFNVIYQFEFGLASESQTLQSINFMFYLNQVDRSFLFILGQ